MPRIEVEPGLLSSAGGRQQELSAQIMGLIGELGAAASRAAGAAGDPGAAGAISDAALSWGVSLEMLAESVGGLGANLGAAASAYTATDSTAVPSGGGGGGGGW